MSENSTCPLEGTEYQHGCCLVENLKNNNGIDACEYKHDCQAILVYLNSVKESDNEDL